MTLKGDPKRNMRNMRNRHFLSDAVELKHSVEGAFKL